MGELNSTQITAVHSRQASAPVLVVSPEYEDFAALRRILNDSVWDLRNVQNLERAFEALERQPTAVIITERDLGPWTWLDLKTKLDTLSLNPEPRTIVACHGADEELWADVLSRGCYDLLIKPFADEEVSWTVGYAWEEWKKELERGMGESSTSLGALA